MAAELSPALIAVMNLHVAAEAAVEAHQGPDDVPKELVDAESRALEALAAVPCTSDEEFHSKLRYLLSVQKGAYGPSWAGSYAKEILQALALHLLQPDETGAQSAPSKTAEKPEEGYPSRAYLLKSDATALRLAITGAAFVSGAEKDALLELAKSVEGMAVAAFDTEREGDANG